MLNGAVFRSCLVVAFGRLVDSLLRAIALFVYTNLAIPNRPIKTAHHYQIYPKTDDLIKTSDYGNINYGGGWLVRRWEGREVWVAFIR